MYNSQDIATRIKSLAKENKINLKQMLSDLNLGINLISQIAKGQTISSINLAKIADYLNCSVDFLLGRDEKVSDNYVISDKYEKLLIDQFRLLSNQGKEYILQTIDMAVAKYKKDTAIADNERKVN